MYGAGQASDSSMHGHCPFHACLIAWSCISSGGLQDKLAFFDFCSMTLPPKESLVFLSLSLAFVLWNNRKWFGFPYICRSVQQDRLLPHKLPKACEQRPDYEGVTAVLRWLLWQPCSVLGVVGRVSLGNGKMSRIALEQALPQALFKQHPCRLGNAPSASMTSLEAAYIGTSDSQ